ncbi:MAG: rod shape-determining protein [Clostridia bacterium]|nr:rod shape-determining protein [Clostridia bacterium]
MPIDLGIDPGTANTLVYEKKRGIVLNEPSMVIRSRKTGQVQAIGNDASDMMGKTPDGMQALRPIRNGVITSFGGTVELLKYVIKKTVPSSFTRVRVVICVPCSITEVERRAMIEAAQTAGAREVYLIEEPLAAAIGCGIDISQPHGSMIVNVGAGLTEVAVVSLGGVVVSQSVRVAGETFDNDIVQLAKKKYNMSIGDSTAEQVKCDIGSVYMHRARETAEINGRDMATALPRVESFSTAEVREAMREHGEAIVDAIKMALENTPPELASDIMESGIVLAGGGAMLRGLGRLINVRTEIPVYIAEEPMECTAKGAGMSLDFLLEMNRKSRFL